MASEKPPPKKSQNAAPRYDRRGAPGKYTPEMVKRIVDLIEMGVPKTRAARIAGISTATFCEWQNAHPEFLEEVRNAEDNLVARAIGRVVSIVDEGEDSVALNAAKFILSHRFPEDFSTRQEVRQTGHDGGAVKVQVQNLDPLTDRLAALDPESLDALLTKVE